MADTYPWGSQSPQARLSKLQRDLGKNQQAREHYMETHRARVAEFDERDRSLKSDIRACETIIDKERTEANSQALAKLLARVASSSNVDLELLLSNPALVEQRLAALGSELQAPASSPKGKKGAASADKPASEPEKTPGAAEA